MPIYQAVTFASADSDELADIATDRRPGYAYARLDNPTDTALADAVAELHDAEAGYVTATGMAAIHLALLSLVSAGDRILVTQFVYGTTRSLLTKVFGRLGIRVDFVDPTDLAAVEAALAAARTRVLYLETISNPTIVVSDLAALAALAHRHGADVVVDNTFASPYLCWPLAHAADIVVESGTKYLSGHSDVLAGVIAGSRDRIRAIRAVQIDTGATLAPFSAFLVLRGIPTLAVRMERHSATASTVAAWLAGRDGVRRVAHPSLRDHPQRAVADRMLAGPGGMLAFELEGGRAAGRAFVDALRIPARTASLGSIHTIVAHPATTTHRQLDDAALATAGIAPGLLRCSVGLEDAPDLLADFAQALEAAGRAHPAEAAAARA